MKSEKWGVSATCGSFKLTERSQISDQDRGADEDEDINDITVLSYTVPVNRNTEFQYFRSSVWLIFCLMWDEMASFLNYAINIIILAEVSGRQDKIEDDPEPAMHSAFKRCLIARV